jgi:hypothetical protein
VTKKAPIIASVSSTAAVEKKASAHTRVKKRVASPLLWLWFTIVIVLGLIIIYTVNSTITAWLAAVHTSANSAMNTIDASSPSVLTLPVQRTSQYADLQITILAAQLAPSFPDDTIHPGSASVRLNLHVTNTANVPVAILYYDTARLLIPQRSPIAPTNTNLSSSLLPGKMQAGWLDFPVPPRTDLKALSLRLGSASLDETMVTIPLTGSFDPRHFAARSSRQTLDIAYNFSGSQLTYHLKNVDVLYSYRGSQARAGQQFYVLNFLVDNPNGAVSPGLGFDYVRLVVNGYSQPPLDSTLPYTFKAAAHAIPASVVFAAPVQMKTITFALRRQIGDAQQSYDVKL